MTKDEMMTEMVARRVARGANETESRTLLAEMIERHSPTVLAAGLVYEGFATVRQAEAFTGLAGIGGGG